MRTGDAPPEIAAAKSAPAHMRELELLFQVSRVLDESLDLRDVVNPVLEALARHLNMQYGTLTLLNRQTREILIEAAHGLTAQQQRRVRYRLGEGVTGTVVLTGRQAIIPRTSESPEFLDLTRRGRRADTSFICVPILVGKEVAGALSVDQAVKPMAALREDARLLAIVASMIARAVQLRRAAQEERDRLEAENVRLKQELRERFRPANIIGNTHEMQQVYDQIAQVSHSAATVLVLGETGTGKELVANAIHYNSDRADGPFVRVHCGALPETIIESELFGHEKGAFTGADRERAGRFELADGGTLFLDEIGDISAHLQIKLLRVLQEREFERVGGARTLRVDVRIIVATHRDLAVMVREKAFREDLYYRLNIFPIYVPPLRKRKADIVLLADHFLDQYSRAAGKPVRRLSSAVIDMLMSYHWPGNVRELENCMERAVLVAEGDVIYPHHLPPTLQTAEATGHPVRGDLRRLVQAYERDLIVDALKSSRGNIARAARALGTTQRIMGYKIRTLGIEPKRYAG